MEVPFFIAITLITSQLLSAGAFAPSSSGDQFLQCLQSSLANLSFPPNHPISKTLYTPQNASFLPTLQSFIKNIRFNRSTTPKPLALVAATHYSHVQATVSWAKVSGVQLRIRSGGHNHEGMSYVSNVSFVVLDMFNLRQVDVDVGNRLRMLNYISTAWVQAGAILGEIYYSVVKKSNNTLAFPAGVCFTVGVGGHISGGGYGPSMRMYGLAVDNVIDERVRCQALRWSCLGASALFRSHKTLEQGATDVVDQWQRVASNLDSKLFIRAQPQATTATVRNKATVRVSFIALYLSRAHELYCEQKLFLAGFGVKGSDLKEDNRIGSKCVDVIQSLLWEDE
ncbi:LOW QUALITY PROTEIN: hypothetical protein V2J09_012606 [Rumex salicifolius]